MFDSYGNGWDGASIVLTLNGEESSFSLDDGDYEEQDFACLRRTIVSYVHLRRLGF